MTEAVLAIDQTLPLIAALMFGVLICTPAVDRQQEAVTRDLARRLDELLVDVEWKPRRHRSDHLVDLAYRNRWHRDVNSSRTAVCGPACTVGGLGP